MGFTNDAEEEDLKMTTSYFYYFLSIPSPRQMAWPLILKDIVYQIRMKSKMQKVKKRWNFFLRFTEDILKRQTYKHNHLFCSRRKPHLSFWLRYGQNKVFSISINIRIQSYVIANIHLSKRSCSCLQIAKLVI